MKFTLLGCGEKIGAGGRTGAIVIGFGGAWYLVERILGVNLTGFVGFTLLTNR